MLISEVTRLSETWEALNAQNQNKILELAQYDMRLERLAVERTKAHQKYYAVEREKEALVAQIAISEKVTKAQKVNLDRSEDERRSIESKLALVEKELSEAKKARIETENMHKSAKRSQQDAEYHKKSAEMAHGAAQKLLNEKTEMVESETLAKRRLEEQVAKLEKDVERYKKKAQAATAAANGQGRYVESDSKDVLEENVMLKVSQLHLTSSFGENKS